MGFFLKTEPNECVLSAEAILLPVLKEKAFGEQVAPFSSDDGWTKVPFDPKNIGSYDATAGSTATAGSSTAGHATYSWSARFTPAGTYYGNTLCTIIEIGQTDKGVGSIITGFEVDFESELMTHIKVTAGGKETPYMCIEEIYSSRTDIDPEGYRGLFYLPQAITVLPETKLKIEAVFRTASTAMQKFRILGYNYIKRTVGLNATGAAYS